MPPAGALRTLRMRVERGQRQLSISLDPSAGDEAGAEALHWIDACRPGGGAEADRLRYRPDALNVVQVLLG